MGRKFAGDEEARSRCGSGDLCGQHAGDRFGWVSISRPKCRPPTLCVATWSGGETGGSYHIEGADEQVKLLAWAERIIADLKAKPSGAEP